MYPVLAGYKRRIASQEEESTNHGHTLNSFRLPRRQFRLPRHIIILEHAETEGHQSVICVQRRSVNESDGDTLARVSDLLDNRIERNLVRSEELFCFFLDERLETALVDGKLVVGRETSGSDVKGIVVTLNRQ